MLTMCSLVTSLYARDLRTYVLVTSGVARSSVMVGPHYNCKFTIPASCLGIFVKDLVHSVSMIKYNYSHYLNKRCIVTYRTL